MDWSQFLTIILQAVIAFAVVMALFVVGAALIKTVRDKT